ncbi:hypothetical protein GJ744_000017 [Endocarpon pusillum]|uniref:Fatty acid hydroxylase domain-containing protein n=1 Tax=Endocarpon pusillum TaxID=364733 RepID=A0A8H7ATU2_9EURO|nr:hypothetical protein GJ744_000017 [Endocarpon pusillum]
MLPDSQPRPASRAMATSLQPETGRGESVFLPRLLLGTLLFVSVFLPSLLQPALNRLYSYLYRSSFYRFSAFETIETIICYAVIETLFTYKFGRNPHLRIDVRGSRQKSASNTASNTATSIDENGNTVTPNPKLPKMRRPSKRWREIFIYAAPLLLMDFTMIKKFAGVPIGDVRASGNYHRDIPFYHLVDQNSTTATALELILSFLIYDTLFFLLHLLLHRFPPLIPLHKPHHTHPEIHPQITNRLSISERLSLVLLANFSLNVIGSHVLTRTLFVPVFVYLLVEIHSGLDLGGGYEKICPGGGVAGRGSMLASSVRTGGLRHILDGGMKRWKGGMGGQLGGGRQVLGAEGL